MSFETVHHFSGPDGGNPLGFLAALGTFRLASLLWPERHVSLGWRQGGLGWRSMLRIEPAVSGEELVEGLHQYCRYGRKGTARRDREEDSDPAGRFSWFTFDKNTSKIEPERFRTLATDAARLASPADRSFADFVAAFGCEACVSDGYVEDTAFRTMSGSGHQHFLGTMFNLARAVESRHIQVALFEPWRYEDPMRKLSMRWDPFDDRRYALQWGDPSSDPTRGKCGSVLGANRLGIEALPLFTTVPVGRPAGGPRLATTGFEQGVSQPSWSWPIWSEPISLDVCRSLIANPLVQALGAGSPVRYGRRTDDEIRGELRRMGVEAVFRSRRLSIDYYRNFSPARAV